MYLHPILRPFSLFMFSDFDEQRCEILQDPLKQQFAEELLAYTDTFNKIVYTSFKGDPVKEAGEILNFACSWQNKWKCSLDTLLTSIISALGSAFDYLETALHKFEDGPFFLGQFSLVCLISVLLVLMMLTLYGTFCIRSQYFFMCCRVLFWRAF